MLNQIRRLICNFYYRKTLIYTFPTDLEKIPVVRQMNPFPKKIRDKDTMQKYLDADAKLSNASLKIDYYDTMLVYIESILKQINNRTFQIKNAIEFMKFNAGLG